MYSCARACQFRDTQIPSAATTVLHIDGRDPGSSLLGRTHIHMDDVRSRIIRMPACVSQKAQQDRPCPAPCAATRQASVRTQRVHCTHLIAHRSRSAELMGAYNILGATLFGHAHHQGPRTTQWCTKTECTLPPGCSFRTAGSCHASAPTGSTEDKFCIRARIREPIRLLEVVASRAASSCARRIAHVYRCSRTWCVQLRRYCHSAPA